MIAWNSNVNELDTQKIRCHTYIYRKHCILVIFTAIIIVTSKLMVIFPPPFLVLVWSTCILQQRNIMDFILQHFFIIYGDMFWHLTS